MTISYYTEGCTAVNNYYGYTTTCSNCATQECELPSLVYNGLEVVVGSYFENLDCSGEVVHKVS